MGFLNESVWELPDGAVEVPELESYDNHRVMSLDEFVRSPVVHDTLHNGAFFQLLGISNYTIPTGPESTSAHVLRQCVSEGDADAMDVLFSVAVARLKEEVWLVTPNERLDDTFR